MIKKIIRRLDKFRRSSDFDNKLKIKREILRTSEELGYLFDNVTGTIQESIIDYDNYTLYELQIKLLDLLLTFIENVLDEEETLWLEKLRPDVMSHLKRVCSYFEGRE